MVNTYIRARSPKGSVGVTDVVDAGELSAYSAGVLSGFTAASAASWTLQIGGVSGTQDVAIAKNPGGESELFSGTAGQSIAFVIGGAPGTPGQSRTDALVIYKDPFTTSVVNNGVDVVDYQVVAGTAATTGTQVPPNEATIRAAIPTGTLKFYTVLGYVTVAYGAGSVTTANYERNLLSPTGALAGVQRYLGFNLGADTSAGGLTTSYVTYATLTAVSRGGLVVVDCSGMAINANSGATKSISYRVQCDGVTVGTAVTGIDVPYLSGQNPFTTFVETFSSTPLFGSHIWTLQVLASANTSVTLRRPKLKVTEISA